MNKSEALRSEADELPEDLPSLPNGLLGQVLRFGIVGGINTLVDLTVLNVLIYMHPAGRSGAFYSLFKTIAFLVAVSNSYLLNRTFTFQSKKAMSSSEISQFLVVSLVGLLINVGVATAVVTFVPAPDFLAKYWPSFAAMTGIPFGLCWNFVGYRYLVFE